MAPSAVRCLLVTLFSHSRRAVLPVSLAPTQAALACSFWPSVKSKKSVRRVVLPAVLFFFAAHLANAQDSAGMEQGTKPYGSYHGGDIDSISVVNGKLTLHVPLISYPQRHPCPAG